MLLVAVAGGVIALAVVLSRITRDRTAPIERHERAIAALRDLAEHPRPVVHDATPPEPGPPEYIHILDEHGRRLPVPADPAGEVTRPSIRPDPNAAVPSAPPPLAPLPAPERPPRSRSRRRPAVVAAAVVTVAAVAAAGTFALAHRPASRHGTAAPTAPTTAPVAATSAPNTVSPTTVAVAARILTLPGGDAIVAVHGPFALSVQVDAKCWVEVRTDAGQVVYAGTLAAGDRRQFPVAPPLTVRLGNASAVAMTVDGAALDLTGVGRTANLRFTS